MASKRNFKVALLVNLARNAPDAVRARANAPADALADLDSEKTGQSYADALRSRGHEVLVKEWDALLQRRAEAPVVVVPAPSVQVRASM